MGRSATIADLEWRLKLVMDKFGPVSLDRVDYALADEFVSELCEERLGIEAARERGMSLMHTITPKDGRRYEARWRSVANSSIRKALDVTEHRGLAWEKVVMIRASDRSALSLARHADPARPRWRAAEDRLGGPHPPRRAPPSHRGDPDLRRPADL
jgi:hypothetical protein